MDFFHFGEPLELMELFVGLLPILEQGIEGDPELQNESKMLV